MFLYTKTLPQCCCITLIVAPLRRRIILLISLAACWSALATITACGPDKLLFYRVTFQAMRSDGISVELIYRDEPREEYVFYSVPSWIENPLYPTAQDPLVFLSVRDASGSDLPVTFDPEVNGTRSFRFPQGAGGPYHISYRLDLSGFDPEDIDAGPLPHLTSIDGFLYGNYLFVYPAGADTMAGDFRTRDYNIHVFFRMGDGVSVQGVSPWVNPPTPYELLFYQLYLGEVQTFNGQAAGIAYDLVYHHHQPTEDEAGYFLSSLPAQITEVVSYFGAPCLSEAFLTISADNAFSGMEATNGFSLEFPKSLIDFSDLHDPLTQLIAEVLLHEMTHLWIGIRLGELMDPWFKEGVTTYLGLLMALKSGFVTEEYFHNSLVIDLRHNSVITQVALSDPRVRFKLFDNPGWSSLVYDKGAQAAFLLDMAIRYTTGNQKTLRDALLYLWSQFAPGAFSREELLEGIAYSTGFDARDFFQLIIDTPGAISLDTLNLGIEIAQQSGLFQRTGWRMGPPPTLPQPPWMMEEAMRQRRQWLRR